MAISNLPNVTILVRPIVLNRGPSIDLSHEIILTAMSSVVGGLSGLLQTLQKV